MPARLDIEVCGAPFDPDQAAATFRSDNAAAGAIVTFLGQVRDDDGAVSALTLEHYEGLTQSEIAKIATDAAARWPVDAITIRHRVGEMAPGEAIVFVAAASAHRRSAFDAADFLMDYLKSAAPFWKRETRGGDARWIEPRAEDYKDRARWNKV